MYCDELHPKTMYFCLTGTHFCLTHTHFCLTRRKVLLATETQHKTENIDDIYFQTCFQALVPDVQNRQLNENILFYMKKIHLKTGNPGEDFIGA